HGHRDVAAPGDEDDRHVGPIRDTLLQLEAVQVRQTHVEHEAARRCDWRMREERLRGCKHLSAPAGVLDQKLERLAYPDVVVDDEDDRFHAGDHKARSLPCDHGKRCVHISPPVVCASAACYSPAGTAASSAARSACSLKGLNKTSTAPCF